MTQEVIYMGAKRENNSEKSVKFTITLAPRNFELLVKLTEEKGLSRSALIAIALDKYAREENQVEK
jgi:hypothetical protein